jgi:tripartite-type tricarboxylate transporter receptor subunit TctC
MKRPKRMTKALLTLVAALALSLVSTAAIGQPSTYPDKPIRVIVPFAAGGIADSAARLVGQKLSDRLGQPVVIDNRGGAGGNIGARAGAQAVADGYTLVATTAAMAVNINLYADPGFKISDFSPVALVASTPNLFAVSPTHSASNLDDLTRLYKGKSITYSSAGTGSSSHLIAQYLFKNLMGLDATHIPYQGGAPAVNAAVAGHVDIVSVSLPTAAQQVSAGRLKGLAVTSLARLDALPGVPTVNEAGHSDFEDYSWVGFLAPAKTDPEIVRRLNAEIRQIVQLPDVRERLVTSGFEPSPGSSQDFSDYLQKETAKWARIIKATGAKAGS